MTTPNKYEDIRSLVDGIEDDLIDVLKPAAEFAIEGLKFEELVEFDLDGEDFIGIFTSSVGRYGFRLADKLYLQPVGSQKDAADMSESDGLTKREWDAIANAVGDADVIADAFDALDRSSPEDTEFAEPVDPFGGLDEQGRQDLIDVLDEVYTDGVERIVGAKLDDVGDIRVVFEDINGSVVRRFVGKIEDPDGEPIPVFKLASENNASFAEYEFAAKKAGTAKKKNCTPGKSTACGGSCISLKKTCRSSNSLSDAGKAKASSVKAKMSGGSSTDKDGSATAKTVRLSNQTRPPAIAITSSRFLLPAAGQTSAPENKRNGEPLAAREIRRQILDKFGVSSVKELAQDPTFRMATNSEKFDLRRSEDLKRIYRRNVGILPDERFESGSKAINGIDVTKYSRPWAVFGIDPQNPRYEAPRGLRGRERKQAEREATERRDADVRAAYAALVKRYHPDVGGDREVFERLTVFKDSLTVKF